MCFKTRVPASSNNSLTAIGINFGLFPIKLHLENQLHTMLISLYLQYVNRIACFPLYMYLIFYFRRKQRKKIFRSKLFNNLFIYLSMFIYITFNSYVILLFHLVYHTLSIQCFLLSKIVARIHINHLTF